jgi:transposase
MPSTRPPYPPEFKLEAAKLYKTSGKSLQEIAFDLGVSTNSLREWVKRAENGDVSKGASRSDLTLDERKELRRLQRENKILREEREILKKAAAFFAQETTRSR